MKNVLRHRTGRPAGRYPRWRQTVFVPIVARSFKAMGVAPPHHVIRRQDTSAGFAGLGPPRAWVMGRSECWSSDPWAARDSAIRVCILRIRLVQDPLPERH